MRRFRFHSLALAAIAALAENTKATMVVPVDLAPDVTVPLVGSDSIRIQLNNVIAALRIVCAKLDLDAGVTDVNYTALALDAAILTAPAKVKAG